MKLRLESFRVLNYRNINDSGPIPVERVTAFVGRNESGKTALLKALHKFNPATPEPYNAQREFPRDRFTAEFRGKGETIPVCEATFVLADEYRATLRKTLGGTEPPSRATCTRHYDGSVKISYDASVSDDPVRPSQLDEAFDSFSKAARRIPAPSPDQEEQTKARRTELVAWIDGLKREVEQFEDLKKPTGVALLTKVRDEANARSSPDTADMIESLLRVVDQMLPRAKSQPLPEVLNKEIEKALPAFIYFENYGILDSAVYLPRLLADMKQTPNDPRVRTINAMFKHVGLTAAEIADLGKEAAGHAQAHSQPVTEDMIAADRQKKELRSIKLNSASNDITAKFNEWYGQRRHNIRYQADGDYFRIWVSDDRRPGVDIELESRSKGFQWFFSFYMVFLVESEERHRDALLLLDEPGLNLHPTAQQELIEFFERLAEKNPLLYSTHSPFLIDGEHIHRVRPVKENEKGNSEVSVDTWPVDRETIFPLQAAAGYAMVRGLFQHKKNVLVEGMSDYLYLHSLNLHCRALGRAALPDDIYITPCGGTKYVGYIASLFLGQEVRPVVLLDSDPAGRERRSALLKELYASHENSIFMLGDASSGRDGQIEDVVGEAVVLPVLGAIIGTPLVLSSGDRVAPGLVEQIKVAATRLGITLPDGWKPEVARRLAVAWSTTDPKAMPTDLLDRAEAVFRELASRFSNP